MQSVGPAKSLSSNRAIGLFGALSFAALLTAGSLHAQPVTDQFVSSANVTATKDCSLLRINFHVRVRYTGHAPQDRGAELRISLQLIDGNTSGDRRLTPREGVRVENAGAAGIQSVVLALDESIGPVLHIQFARPMAYQIVQSGSFDSIDVAISKNGSAAACGGVGAGGKRSDQNDKQLRDIPVGTGVSVREKSIPAGKLSEADTKIIDASMDEARDAIKKNKFAEAIEILKKMLRYPENKSSAEAQELLGVARLKAGQREAARAEFENYLRRYQNGEGSERVRQRLAGILTAAGAAPDKLRGGLDVAGLKNLGPKGETRWNYSASVSALYITDDSTSTVKDISTAADPNADPDAHRSHLNTLLTNYDMFGTADNDQMKAKFKFAVTHEHQLDNRADSIGVSTAQVDYTLKEYDLTTRIGRQSRNTGGVIGRFDGAVVSWDQSPGLRWNVLAGSPNWSRFDVPFANGKTLYGASVDFSKVFGFLDTTLFAIEQFDQSLVDRQAVGAEFRYFDRNKSALGTIDYDVHFQQLNAAIFSGTYTLDDKSVLNAALDYRKVPYLSSWNALQGQPFLTLYDMMKFSNSQDIKQLAIDRTPTFESAMLSYSRPLNETYQVGGDVTVTNLTGTLPSGGVDGTAASGLEYYLSAQLTGAGVFAPGDLFMGAVRYASLSDSNVYVIDINTRYPVSPSLAVSPRLRLGYRTGVGTDLKEVTILPSILVSYLWSRELSFEAEVGTKYLDTRLAGMNSTTRDIFGTLTVRRDFNTDGVSKCHGSVVSCAWALPAAMRSGGPTTAPVLPQKSVPPILPAFAIEGGLRYWFSTAKNRYNYFADPTPSTVVSRLSYTGLTAHSGEAFFRIDAREGPLTNVFAKGYIGGGHITSGKLYDEDFPPFIDQYSKTSSNANGRLQYASIDLGYNIFEIERFRLGAFVGYHRWLETVDARGCIQVGGHPFICVPALISNAKVITEEDTWNTLRAGFSTNGKVTDKLSWQGDFAYTWTSQQALDTHYFTFGSDPASGHGTGFQAEALLNYQPTARFNVGVGGRWWRFSTNAVDSFNQLLQYATDRYGVFLQAAYKLN